MLEAGFARRTSRLQSAQADFAFFQRRIHSLLDRRAGTNELGAPVAVVAPLDYTATIAPDAVTLIGSEHEGENNAIPHRDACQAAECGWFSRHCSG
jgi:hypothetical protein